MTHVQLPEVPADSFGYRPSEPFADNAFRFGITDTHTHPLYTAVQLREYATEAVMAERARLRTAVADYMHSEGCSCCRGDDHDEHKAVIAGLLGVAPYSDNSGFDFSPYRAGATQPEQNSGR